MNNDELLNKIKIYEERILCLENELNMTKEHLKKYTAPSNMKKYYENHKEEIKQKVINIYLKICPSVFRPLNI